MYFMNCDGLSHAGTAKEVNEDRFVIAEIRPSTSFQKTNLDIGNDAIQIGRPFGNLMIVSDGSGEPEDAARASTIAVDSLVKSLMNDFHWSVPLDTRVKKSIEDQLLAAFWCCQETIVREANVLDESRRADMSASVGLAWVCWPDLLVATAGNCRALLVRNGESVFLSRDDTTPLSKIPLHERAGSESLDDAGEHVLINLVGGLSHQLSPAIQFLTLEMEDSLLLCTDGVTRSLANERLVEILASPVSASEACEVIINEALRINGSDNITAVVAKIARVKMTQTAVAEVEQSLSP